MVRRDITEEAGRGSQATTARAEHTCSRQVRTAGAPAADVSPILAGCDRQRLTCTGARCPGVTPYMLQLSCVAGPVQPAVPVAADDERADAAAHTCRSLNTQ